MAKKKHRRHKGKKGANQTDSGLRVQPSRTPQQAPKPQSVPFFGSVSRHLKQKSKAAVGVVAFLCGVIPMWYMFKPAIRIDRDITLDSKDPFATEFVISNPGNVAVKDLVMDCIIDAPPFLHHAYSEGANNQYPIRILKPGDRVTRKCSARARDFPLDVTLQLKVRYKASFGRSEEYTAVFKSHLDADHTPQWYPDSE